MEIFQVEGTLVCTQRVDGLRHSSLRVLKNASGKRQVAVDPVGVNPGNWVFTASGSAARFAAESFEVLTDLTVCGIIDNWPQPEGPAESNETAASA
jgi:ethanolamine utilization protein EutN